MNVKEFKRILEGLSCSDYNTFSTAEVVFNEMLSENKEVVIPFLINAILNIPEKVLVNTATVLLQRIYTMFSPYFLTIGDENYHKNLQDTLIQLFVVKCEDPHILKCLAHVLSCFAVSYCNNWPNFYHTLLESLKSDRCTVRLIGSECMWKCISDNTIPPHIVCQPVFEFINEVLCNYSENLFHLLQAGTRLAFFLHKSTQNNEIANLSIPIIHLYHNMPSIQKVQFLDNLGFLADADLSFFSPSIGELFVIINNVLLDPAAPSKAINTVINILDKIIIKKVYGDIIKHHKLEIFDLMVSSIRNAMIAEREYDSKNRPITLQVAEDLLYDLALVYCIRGNFFVNITVHFKAIFPNAQDFLAVRALLIAYVSIAEGSAEMFANLHFETNVIPFYLSVLTFDDHDTRLIAVESINRLLFLIGTYDEECKYPEVFPALLQLASSESCVDILHSMIRCVTTYVKMFNSCQMYIPALVTMLESNYAQMDFRLQTLVIECYKFAYKRSPENFPFFDAIFQRVSNVLSDSTLHSHSLKMFFACMKFAPYIDQTSIEAFAMNSANILLFIASVDVTNLSSRQMDTINKTVRAILKRNLPQIAPFAKRIVELAVISATKEITICFTEPFGALSPTKSSALTPRFNPTTKETEFLSNIDIELVVNALVTLKSLLTSSVDLMLPYVDVIFGAINKILNDRACPDITLNAFAVIPELIKFINFGRLEGIQIARQLLVTTIQSFTAINPEDYQVITRAFRCFKRFFLDLSKVAANEEALGLLLAVILNFYQNLRDNYEKIPENQRNDFLEEFIIMDDAENEMSYLFQTIFQYYYDFYEPFHQNVEETLALRPMSDGTVSRAILRYWLDYAMLYPKCSPDRFNVILVSLKEMVTYCVKNSQNLVFCQNVISAYTSLLSSSRLPVEAAVSELPFICQFLYSKTTPNDEEKKLSSFAHTITRPVMLIIARMIDSHQDPTNFIVLFLELIDGLKFLVPEPNEDMSIPAFFALTQSNHRLLVNLEGTAALFYLATRLLDVALSNDTKQRILNYIVTLMKTENWNDINAYIKAKCNIVTQIHVNKCVEQAVSMVQQAQQVLMKQQQ